MKKNDQNNGITRRTALKSMGVGLAAVAGGLQFPAVLRAADSVKISFVSAMTGLETILGETQLNCFKLAVEEINANGGAGGRKIDYLVEDDQTTTKGTIDKMRKAISRDRADVVIGLITSMERVAALSVSKPAKKLLIYPTYYEGGECEKYLVCTGQIPNQSVDPFVPWLMKNVGKSVFIMGSDYVWPRKTADAVKSTFESGGGKVLGAEFFPFGTQDFGPALQKVKAANPDMVWSMFAGNDALTALKQYRSFEMKPKLVTNGLDELFSTSIPAGLGQGIIVNQSYFFTLNLPSNKKFIESYQNRFGQGKLVNAIGEATYCATWLYAKAVAKADSTDVDKVVKAISEVDFDAPQGHVNISAENQHMVCNSIIGQGREDGLFEIIENFGQIQPIVPGCNLA